MQVIRRYSIDVHSLEDGTLHLQLNKMVADLNVNQSQTEASITALNGNVATMQQTIASQQAQIEALTAQLGTLGAELQPTTTTKKKK